MAENFINLNNLTYYDSKIKSYADNKYELKDSTIVKDLNYVHTDNNYTSIDKQKLDAMSNGSKYIGLFPTLTERDVVTNLISGYWCTINVDSSHSNKKTKYYYDGTQWIYDGEYQDDSFLIDDTSTNSTSSGWSANKINTELGLKADNTSIPTKTSQLTNDSNYLIQSDLTSNYTTTTDLQTNYALKSDLTGKVNTIDIIDNLTSTDTIKPLSANQGSVIKTQIDSKTQINDSATTSTNDTYSIDKIISLLTNKQNKIIVSATKPIDLTLDNLWLDISNSTTYRFLRSNGTDYIQIGSSSGGTISNQIIVQVLEPTDTSKLWLDISNSTPVLKYYDTSKWESVGEISKIENLGTGAKVLNITTDGTLQSKTIKAGSNVVVNESIDGIYINSTLTGNANGSIGYSTSTSSSFDYDNTKIDYDAINVKLKGDVVDSYTTFLVSGVDGSDIIKDVIRNRELIKGGNATISTTQKVLGVSSLYAPNTSATGDCFYTTSNVNDFNFGTGDFTIAFRYYCTGYGQGGNYGGIISTGSGSALSSPCWMIRFNNAIKKLSFEIITSTSTSYLDTSTTIPTGSWHHYEFSREGDVFRIFIDGVLNATYTGQSGKTFNGTGVGLYLFRSWSSGYPQYDGQGYICDIKIDKGIARHTSNFTPLSYAQGTNYDISQYNVVKMLSTSLMDASQFYQVNGIAITQNIPTGTDIKWALDIGDTYSKVWDNSTNGWVDCTDIGTNGMSASSITTALTNYSWNNLSDKFGLVCALKSSDVSITPTVSNIDINYLASPPDHGHIISGNTATYIQRKFLKFAGAVSITDDSANDTTVVTYNNSVLKYEINEW